jgi:hypothetical protein
MNDCWEHEQEKRPSFETILKNLMEKEKEFQFEDEHEEISMMNESIMHDNSISTQSSMNLKKNQNSVNLKLNESSIKLHDLNINEDNEENHSNISTKKVKKLKIFKRIKEEDIENNNKGIFNNFNKKIGFNNEKKSILEDNMRKKSVIAKDNKIEQFYKNGFENLVSDINNSHNNNISLKVDEL